MELVHPVCCGLDVHKASITACLRCVMTDGMIKLENRTFDTNMRGLTSLLEWMVENGYRCNGIHGSVLEACIPCALSCSDSLDSQSGRGEAAQGKENR